MIDYRAGIQNGMTTRVGPKNNMSLAAPRSTWQIVFAGNGWTQAARVVMQNSVDYWASEVASDVTIKIKVTFKDLPGNTLGSAGPSTLLENWVDGDAAADPGHVLPHRARQQARGRGPQRRHPGDPGAVRQQDALVHGHGQRRAGQQDQLPGDGHPRDRPRPGLPGQRLGGQRRAGHR